MFSLLYDRKHGPNGVFYIAAYYVTHPYAVMRMREQ